MIGRVLATLAIAALLALDLALPWTGIGRRGTSAARLDEPASLGRVGERLPELSLRELDGSPFRLADVRGHRVLLTFERSVDW